MQGLWKKAITPVDMEKPERKGELETDAHVVTNYNQEWIEYDTN